MKILNLTPHPINLICDNGITITFKPSGTPARVEIKQEKKMMDLEISEGVVLTVPVVTSEHVAVYGLPAPEPDTFYIVSSMVASAVSRPDVLAPNTDSTADRDPNGRITGVKSFQQIYNSSIQQSVMGKFESYLQAVASIENPSEDN